MDPNLASQLLHLMNNRLIKLELCVSSLQNDIDTLQRAVRQLYERDRE